MKMWKKMKKDVEAISPVVATLLLIVVAVTAVSALWVWENGWQNGITNGIGNQQQPTQLTLAGSTTVNDFMTVAVPQYMAINPNYKVTVDPIGSGAGLTAIEQKKCDIGMISDDLNAVASGTTVSHPELQVTTIAYDGVVMFIGTSAMTAHGLTAATMKMTQSIADGIYGANGHTVAVAANLNDANNGAILTWGDLETAMGAPIVSGADALITHYRSDSSGTQDSFCDKMLNAHKFLGAGHLGTAVGENGNSLMIQDVIADPLGIGFACGAMVGTTSGASAFTFGVDLVVAHQISGTVAKNVMDGVLGLAGGYTVWHPLNLVVSGNPTGEDLSFINYVTDPSNNINFCAASGFTSIFQAP